MFSWVVMSVLATGPASYAIVVGNNASPTLARRALLYADDDAVKYFEVFKGLLGPGQARLLTLADADTARLHPSALAVASAPTRTNVLQAFADTAAEVKRAHEAGQKAQVYFVFAGHGDVDQGRGFLELQDGAFTGDDMEQALKSLQADQVHVILDSCNSFFVLSPRKPGGRHFTTPKDAALQLAERLPNVGVLLSTSAEAEVYEWSELQSGIFSHAVRSALTGVADVDGDGTVSYAEMAAFIDTATRSVPNPNFRPKVFSRGPNGNAKSPLVSFATFSGIRVSAKSDQPLRLTIRDAEGVRWFDLHSEAKVPLTLRLPALDLTVERIDDDQVRAYALGQATEVDLMQLEAHAPVAAARGAAEALRALYQTPWGPNAFAAWQAEAANEEDQPTEYIGLSKTDLERMHIILDEAATRDRSNRKQAGALVLASGMAFAAFGAGEALINSNRSTDARWMAAGLGLGLGALMSGFAMICFFHLTDWEKQAAMLDAALAEGRWQQGVADADAFVEEEHRNAQVHRWILMASGIAGIAVGVAGYTFFSLDEYRSSGNALTGRLLSLVLIGIGGAALVSLPWLRDPGDDLLNVWRRERSLSDKPSVTGLDVTVVPGGAGLSLSGRF
jgi:hypothetical protein